ncbi:hypothetical protein ACH5RR_032504 [Cinchona calisaya]|uniref:Uncharacterized protein n=1 Tax=Cinchona calisaya TaxID=153742 RepID=A0ABD2YMP6_9GENT
MGKDYNGGSGRRVEEWRKERVEETDVGLWNFGEIATAFDLKFWRNFLAQGLTLDWVHQNPLEMANSSSLLPCRWSSLGLGSRNGTFEGLSVHPVAAQYKIQL